MAPGPITHDFALRCSPERAFEVYVARIGEWWDARYTANAETYEAVTIEPRLGGRVYATHSDLGEHDWGEVAAWEPGRRLVHTFALAQSVPSEVSVQFAASREGCDVHFEHGGWADGTEEVRAKFGDWPVLLDRFRAIAEEA